MNRKREKYNNQNENIQSIISIKKITLESRKLEKIENQNCARKQARIGIMFTVYQIELKVTSEATKNYHSK